MVYSLWPVEPTFCLWCDVAKQIRMDTKKPQLGDKECTEVPSLGARFWLCERV